MLRYTQDSWENGAPSAGQLWGDDPFPAVDSNWDQPGRSLVLQLNQNIGRRAVNTLQFSYSANASPSTRGGEDAELNEQINDGHPPRLPGGVKHYGADRAIRIFWGGGGYAPSGTRRPSSNNQDLFVLKDDYSQVFGRHFFKVGVLVSTNKKNEDVGGGSASRLRSSGAPRASAAGADHRNVLADFLLKDMTCGFAENPRSPLAHQRWQDLEAYVPDSWKVHPRLTLDLGVRYSYFPNPYEADDRVASFDPPPSTRRWATTPATASWCRPGSQLLPAEGAPRAARRARTARSPRTRRTCSRRGWAWPGTCSARQDRAARRPGPVLSCASASTSSWPSSATRRSPRRRTACARWTAPEPCAGCFALGNGVPANGRETRGKVPYNWQWNVTVSSELFKNTTLELGYVGNKGRDITRKVDLNQVPAPNTSRLRPRQRQRRRPAALRPYGVFGDARITSHDHSGSSIYHSLQTQIVSRFGNRSQFQASYTWSRMIDDATADVGNALSQLSVTDSSQLDLDRGLSPQSRKHVFNASLVLNGPSLEGRSASTRRLLGDWQFTSAMFASSGQPITVYMGNVPGITNGPAGTGFADNSGRTACPASPAGATAASEAWLNPAAFTLLGYQLGTSGDSGRGICDGPGIFQADLALYKTSRSAGA